MAARKQQFFHGTTFDVQGDITPAKNRDASMSVWGGTGHSGQRSDQHAFATEDENIAWRFASQAGWMKRSEASAIKAQNAEHPGVQQTVPDVGRVAVHRVAPHPLMQKGVYHADHPHWEEGEDLKEWTAPAFHPVEKIDTMPGRQGTFPNLNWNQFRHEGSGYMTDMNHPSDHEIEHGHAPARATEMRKAMERGIWKSNVADAMSGVGRIPGDTSVADEHQMDLFSGKTVGEHAEHDPSDLGEYHRNNLFGR